jgi:hypothetical protein
MYMTAVPGYRCSYSEQAGGHRACPPDEGELPETAAI